MELAVADSFSHSPKPIVDGFGERRVVTNARGDRLDVLRLATSLTSNTAFESALRDCVTRLSGFHHESYSHVRSLEAESDSGALFLVSDHVRGTRLSALLATAEQRELPVDVNAVRGLIRQLVRAVASWREQMPDIFHGSIAPERIVVTPTGRLILVEHVFGAALGRLGYSRARFWDELRLPLPHTQEPLLDAVADVTQVGAVALAIALGRPIRTEEFADGFHRLLDSSRRSSGDALPPLREWLRRALQLDRVSSFVSVVDARPALSDVLGEANPLAGQSAVQSFLAKCLVLEGRTASEDEPSVAAEPMIESATARPGGGDVSPHVDAVKTFLAQRTSHKPVARVDHLKGYADDPMPLFAPEGLTAPPIKATPRSDDLPLVHAQQTAHTSPPVDNRKRRIWTTAALAAIVVALATTFFVLRNQALGPTVATGQLLVATTPAGITVEIDGAPRGVTPLTVDLPPGDHVVELLSSGTRRRVPVTIRVGSQVSQFLEMSPASATTGQLFVRTDPPTARVSVDGRAVGQSPISVAELSPGTHVVTLQHQSGTITERVVIEAGKTSSLVVPLAPRTANSGAGWISVTAPADVQILENGRLLGSSNVERIMVPAGNHDLEIVHEQLGYRQQRSVRVAAGQVANIELPWPTGTVAINAIPWAEAFVDGASVGETPIGSLQLPIGTHEIVFRHPQLGEQRARVTVTVGQTAKVGIDMRSK